MGEGWCRGCLRSGAAVLTLTQGFQVRVGVSVGRPPVVEAGVGVVQWGVNMVI